MTSEPDSTARRPPTIDLTATEVGTDETAAADAADPGSPPSGTSGSLKYHAMGAFVGALVGVAVMAALIAGLWFGGYVPPRETALPSSASAQSSLGSELTARLDKIESAMRAQQPNAALAARVTAAETAEKSQSEALAALAGRVNDAATAAQNAQTQAKNAADAANTAQNAAKNATQSAVSRSDLDALSGRVAALETAVKTLSDAVRQAASADDRVARLMVAADALRAAIERDAPYPAELAAVKSLGVAQSATAPLEPFAATGVPSAAALGHELAALLPALQQATSPAANSTSFLDRLEANAHQLVRITPVDAPPGDDPASVVERIGIEAARADIAAALADIAKLPPAAQSAVAAWVQKAQARNAAIAAARQISDNALAALGTPNPQ